MNKLTHIFIFLLFACAVSAQTKFIDRLTRVVAGQGRVTVNQDKRLTDLINEETSQPSAEANNKVEKDKEEEEDETPALVTPTGKKTKVRGYRVQIYWGGSNRTDQARAQRAANQVATLFPQYKAYTSFESPHWRCRVGDFTDRHDAVEALRQLKKAGIASEAMIVRSEVFIYK